jgi:predicted acylesterase/phospholipase RssA
VAQYRRRAWDGLLRQYLHNWRLEQLLIPFHAITVDLVQVGSVVRSQGDAVQAILESINLPIISKPILSDGMALVDGGVLNNLPADVLAENGVDFVVGVDVSTHVRPEFAGNRPDMPTGKMKDAGVPKGFIIQRVNDEPMRSFDDLQNAVKEANNSKDQMLVIRGIFPTGKKGGFVVYLQNE